MEVVEGLIKIVNSINIKLNVNNQKINLLNAKISIKEKLTI